jgi:hypothetical protein
VGSAAASFLVQCVGPDGFATRQVPPPPLCQQQTNPRVSCAVCVVSRAACAQEIGRRIERGEVQGKESSRKSVTAYTPPPSERRRQSLDC